MKKILVLDDDKLVLASVDKILKKEGYLTELAQSAQEALEKAQAQEFDLVISDIRMPGKNGVEAVREIRRLFDEKMKKDIPIIFITGYASEEAPIQAIKLGVCDYILKPFNLDELLRSIEKYIQ